MKIRPLMALAATATLAFAACTPGASTPPGSSPAASTGGGASSNPSSQPSSSAAAASVRLQLQWAPQAQFAGYFAADSLGYYKAENLTVEMVAGGPTVVPQQVGSAPDGPEFTISWVPKVLEAREQGSDLVNIAQIFQRSGTLSVTWKKDGYTNPCDLKGKKVGTWGFGNQYEVTAGLKKCSPPLVAGTDYENPTQNFDMLAFLSHDIDAAEAMIYNEYAQVLEATNPETGQLYSPDDLTVFNWNDFRVAMLQDAIFARASWLKDPANRDVAVRFVRASIKGWIYCRDHQDDCVKFTTDAGSELGAGHQRWMMNEINALVWPSPEGVGVLDPVFYNQTINVAIDAGIIKNRPPLEAYDQSIATEASQTLTGEDLKGLEFKKGTVAVTPGGK